MNSNTYNKEFWYINNTPAFLDSETELVENVWIVDGKEHRNGFRRMPKELAEIVRRDQEIALENEKLRREIDKGRKELRRQQEEREELRMQQELDAYNNSWLGKFINFVGSRTYWLLVAGSALIITIINY